MFLRELWVDWGGGGVIVASRMVYFGVVGVVGVGAWVTASRLDDFEISMSLFAGHTRHRELGWDGSLLSSSFFLVRVYVWFGLIYDTLFAIRITFYLQFYLDSINIS